MVESPLYVHPVDGDGGQNGEPSEPAGEVDWLLQLGEMLEAAGAELYIKIPGAKVGECLHGGLIKDPCSYCAADYKRLKRGEVSGV